MVQETDNAMRGVDIPRYGEAEVMRIRDLPRPEPAAGEVLIQIAAAGINHGDLVQRRGNYPPPPGASSIPGLEVAGTIVARAPDVTRWQPGDEVCAILAGGGYASYCTAPADQCLPIPRGISLIDAASLPETFCTVWDAVWGQARLGRAESLLVHGGSSGIGVTAIQLARALGHPVYATAGSPEKCSACRSLGATAAIDYKRQDFVEEVRQATAGQGVDVILDMVGGGYLPRNMSVLAMHGRQVSIGVQDGPDARIDVREMMRKRLTLIGTTLRSRDVAYKARICRELETHVWPLFAAEKIRPVIHRRFPLDAVAQAHRALEQGGHVGKMLLIP